MPNTQHDPHHAGYLFSSRGAACVAHMAVSHAHVLRASSTRGGAVMRSPARTAVHVAATYSPFTPASAITFAHFARSALMRAAASAGVVHVATAP